MQRPARKDVVHTRVSATSKAWVVTIAKRLEVDESTVVRAMLAVATQHQDEVFKRITVAKES